MLNILDCIPANLLTTSAADIHRILSEPTLICIPGRRNPPLFVSCLVHGNETTGLLVIQELLRKLAGKPPARTLRLFVGNVRAASLGRRHLDNQPDYNRIWKPGDLPENKIAMNVIGHLKETGVFASIDIHNNTGRNPHYSCLTRIETPYLNLARVFADVTLYFPALPGTLTSALSDLCPAVTLESGLPGLPDGTQHALEVVETVLRWETVPTDPARHGDLRVMDIAATVRVPGEAIVGYQDDQDADIRIVPDCDLLNFKTVKPGTVWGWVKPDSKHRFAIERKNLAGGDDGVPGADYFEYVNGEIRNRVPVIPSMITMDKRIIKSDCLGYVMRELPKNQIMNPNAT